MGEILSALTGIITRVVDVLLSPFGSHRAAGLIVFSMITGAALTLLYRALADEAAIRRTREIFKARVLEMRLYPDDMVLIFRALGGALAAQGSYLRVAAKPILIVALIAVPLFIQVESRYAHAPLKPGTHTLITARLKSGLDSRTVPVTLAPMLLSMPVPPPNDPHERIGIGTSVDGIVRAPAEREVSWRVAVREAGDRRVALQIYDQPYYFELATKNDNRAIGHERRARSIMGRLTDIGLPRIGTTLRSKQ